MNRVKILIRAVAFLFLLNIGLIFFLVGRRPSPRHGPKHKIIQLLELDSKQVKEYEEMIKIHEGNITAQDEKIVALKQELYKGLIDNQVDTDSLLALLSKEKTIVEKMHYRHFNDLEKLCKDDQKDNFKKLTKELTKLFSVKERRGKKRHKMKKKE